MKTKLHTFLAIIIGAFICSTSYLFYRIGELKHNEIILTQAARNSEAFANKAIYLVHEAESNADSLKKELEACAGFADVVARGFYFYSGLCVTYLKTYEPEKYQPALDSIDLLDHWIGLFRSDAEDQELFAGPMPY
jgi:hypothetical protein